MHHRTFMLAAVAAGTFLLPVGDAVAPTTLKYKIVQRTEQSIDASAMGQGEQKVMMGYSAYLTVELDDSASGRSVKVKVDSLRTDADAEPTFAAMLSRSDGASGSGFIDEKGELVAFSEANADSSATPSALRGLLSSLFPAVKPSAAPGQAWSDTT